MSGPKTDNIEQMFNSIAADYGKLNHILSQGTDKSWRKKALKEIIVVDVGVVEHCVMKNGKSEYKQYEVDFIASYGNEKYYIQSAYEIPDDNKREQEYSNKGLSTALSEVTVVGYFQKQDK